MKNTVPQHIIKQRPFVRILFPFVLGISWLRIFPNQFNVCIIIIGVLIAVCLVYSFSKIGKTYRNSTLSASLWLVFLIVGLICYQESGFVDLLSAKRKTYSGVVYNSPFLKNTTCQFDCKILISEGIATQNTLVKIYYRTEPGIQMPKIGDSVKFIGIVNRIQNKGKTGAFNFAQYMADQGIYYTAFVKSDQISLGGWSGKYPIKRAAAYLQKYLMLKFEKYGFRSVELAVISALIVGDKTLMDKDVQTYYTGAGAMHVLAVSGLHVAILFLFLSFLLGKRNQRLYYRIFTLFISLLVIWLFAFISGMCPSVQRACVMFSLFLVGKSFRKEIDSYNLMAASAFILLVINPRELFMVGFQLSYIAVLGILIIQPRIAGLFNFKNSTLNYIWELLTLSIAAQIATLPLCLFYFHQFPVYFWLTNILIIPLVWLIMMGAMVFCITLPWGFLAGMISWLLLVLVKLLNFVVELIAKLPGSQITNIRFEFYHLIIVSLTLIILLIIIYWEKYRSIIVFMNLTIIGYLTFDWIDYLENKSKIELVVYSAGNREVFSLINGYQHTVLANTEIIANPKLLPLGIEKYWVSRRIHSSITYINIDSIKSGLEIVANNLFIKQQKGFLSIQYQDQYLIYLNVKLQGKLPKIIDVQNDAIIVIGANSGYPPNDREMILRSEKIIALPSTKRRIQEAWQDYTTKKHIPFVIIVKEGSQVMLCKR